jgi:hypothetical protein
MTDQYYRPYDSAGNKYGEEAPLTHRDITAWEKRNGISGVDYINFAPYDMPVADRRKVDVGDIYINQVRHLKCGWFIRSRNRHDYVTCICGGLSIDGGSWYTKLVGDVDNAESHVLPYKHVEEREAK